MKIKKAVLFLVVILVSSCLFASEITFGGGYTRVSLQDGNHSVLLSGSAFADTGDVRLESDSIELYGDDYNTVKCTGNVKVEERENGITLESPKLVYDRDEEILMADGWVEIDDTEHEVKLSCAWLEYNQKTSIMTLQVGAKIVKDTDDGLMTCTADSIEYNADSQMVTLKGKSKVVWGQDTYSASIITVNLDTEEVTLHGSISGVVNGK